MNFTLHALDIELEGLRRIQIIAMSGQTLAGTIEVHHPHRRSAAIVSLFVNRRFRRKGIGRALVERCCEIAKEHECATIGLSLDKANAETEAFYQKLGFKFGFEFSEDYLLVREL